jgi:hypothetical protein
MVVLEASIAAKAPSARLCPWRIGDILAAALVLSTLERGHY